MPVADPDVADSVLEDAGPAAALHLADLEHPWLGLESFREETRAYFFGRDTEIADLHLRLRSHPLLVLYGRSGLGKTSILMAGLIPRLRGEERRPLLLRLRYEDPTSDVCGQLVSAVFGSGDGQGGPARLKPRLTKSLLWTRRLAEELNLALPDDLPSCLWLRLHYRAEPPDITHLILDQFEEVFTLGARRAGAEDEVRDTLAILLQGTIPDPISRLIAEHDSFLDHFDPDSVPVRVILALRDDYVYALNRWRRHLPALGQNNFELRALRGPAAFDAVFKPGGLRCHYRGEVSEENKADTGLPPIVSAETAQRIVRFVAKKGEEVPIEEIEAVPPILSLLCRELNERRFTERAGTAEAPAGQITFRESEADIETIIAAFYERCLAGRPEAVRIFIEEELVSYSGARLAQDDKSILRVFEEGYAVPGAADGRRAAGFGDATAARACLEDLVNQRLLSSLGGGEKPSYELIHDLLATVAEKSRTAREDRFAKEEADRRTEAERKARENAEAEARRAKRRVIAVTAALVLAVITALIGFVQYRNAEAAKQRAEEATKRATDALEEAKKAKAAADGLINFMQYDLRDTLKSLGRLDMMVAINSRVRKYHADHPAEAGDLEALREEAAALMEQGDLLLAQGRLRDASDQHQAAFKMFKELLEQQPDSTDYQHNLSVSFERVGDVQSEQGDLAGALKSYRDSLAIREKLAKQDPGNADWQRNLSISFEKVGDVQSAQGDRAGALKSYRDGLAIREKLAKQDPGNAGWQRDLSISFERVGNVQSAQGDLAGALKSYRDSLAIAEKLTKQDPGNAGWQRDLSVSVEKVGDVQRAQDDLAGALKSYRDSLAIREKLAKQDPGNAGWQRDLSVSFNKVGNVQSAQGDLAGALKSYRDGLAIAEKLAKQDPGNAEWQRDLSISFEKVGDVQRAQGDFAGALKGYRDRFAIAEKLAKQDPGNAGWQGDLAESYWETGMAWAKAEPKSQT